MLVFMASHLVGYEWAIWEPSGELGKWLEGLRSISPALRASSVPIARLRDDIMSFCNRFHPVTTDIGSEREPTGPRDGVISATV